MPNLSTPPVPTASGAATMLHYNNTFGIELEFFLIYPWDRYRNNDCGAYEAIAATLNEHGVTCQHVDKHESMLEEIPEDPSQQTLVQRYLVWRVTDDAHSLTHEQEIIWKRELESDPEMILYTGDFHIASVELVSRKLFYHQDAWQSLIQTALNAIHTLELDPGFKLFTNAECGFHVHVGNINTRVQLPAARDLAKFVTAFEPQIEALHTADRVSSYDDFCMSKSPSYINLANVKPESTADDLTMRAFLQRIHWCSSFAQVADIFSFPGIRPGSCSDGKLSNYNFDQLFQDETCQRAHILKTVEFRQHSGTLDILTIINWIHVVQAIFMAAQYQTFDQVVAASRAADGSFSTVQLLRHIGVAEEVVMWYVAKLDPSSGFINQYYFTQTSSFESPKFDDFVDALMGPDMAAMQPDNVRDQISFKRRKWVEMIQEKADRILTDAEIEAFMAP